MQRPAKNIIIIPVYKHSPDTNEVKSLVQCFKVLHAFPVCFVCGDKFSFENYLQFIPEGSNYTIERFNDKYFISIDAYNKLLLSLDFYKSFRRYEYMLIYQLDAWVFKDELKYWCTKGFSFIGAPWFEGWNKASSQSRFIGVGNGGFSLRNIKEHVKVLQYYKYSVLPRHYLTLFFKKMSPGNLRLLIKNVLFNNSPYHKYYPANEDTFWGRVAPKLFKNFTIPDMETALRFSVEVNPSKYVNADDLPFGCHAWEKFEPQFWEQFIDA